MHVRGTVAALALASLFVQPMPAVSAIVQKWQSYPASYTVVSRINDFNADGSYEMLTLEPAAGGTAKIGIRSCTSGGLLSQSAATYQPGTFWLTYLEDTNSNQEIIFSDGLTGNLVCMNYSGGALSTRWSFLPTTSGVPVTWAFVPFDASGVYMVFKDVGANTAKYYVRNNSGVLVSTIDLTTTAPGSGWTPALFVDDFEATGRQELMIDYHYTGVGTFQDVLYMFDSNSPAPTMPTAGAGESSPGQQARRAVHRIEPVNGVWTEAGPLQLEAGADPRASRLP